MYVTNEHWALRPMVEDDAAALADLWADPGITRWLGGPRDRDFVENDVKADVKADQQPAGDALWTLVDRRSGTVAGHCGLLKKTVDGEPVTEVIYVLAEAFQGRGWATEVATALVGWAKASGGVPWVVALIVPENLASRRVAQKAGLEFWKTTLRDDGSVREVWRG